MSYLTHLIAVKAILASSCLAYQQIDTQEQVSVDVFTKIAHQDANDSVLPAIVANAIYANNPSQTNHISSDKLLQIESQLETYTDIVEQGCFYCKDYLDTSSIDYSYSHCVDVCKVDRFTKEPFVEPETWSQKMNVLGSNVDSLCSQIIQNAVQEVIGEELVSGVDAATFGESLVADERSQICFAYDPRDVLKRRLQGFTSDRDCNNLDCFDCSATAGSCLWDPERSFCLKTPDNFDVRGLRWWHFFEYCKDTEGICTTGLGNIQKIAAGSETSESLGNEDLITFQMSKQAATIPKNYFCRWQIDLETGSQYQLKVRRQFYPIQEQLELSIMGKSKTQLVYDRDLASTSPEIEWEKYAIINTKAIWIFARNREQTADKQTFQVTLQQTFSAEEASQLQQLTLLLMMVLLCCLCVACCTVMLRLRCKLDRQRVRQQGGGNEAVIDDADVDEETRARNRAAVAQRAQQRGSQRDNREEMARQMHMSLIDQYTKLIPLLKFKKNDKELDEFNTAECVICMEAFTNGTKVRKVPSCRHIFHDECLMKWLSGSQMQEYQKCPMCNSDITINILEKAIEEQSNAKSSGGILGGIFSRSPQKQRAPVPQQPPQNNRQQNAPIQQPQLGGGPPIRADSLHVRDFDSVDSGRAQNNLQVRNNPRRGRGTSPARAEVSQNSNSEQSSFAQMNPRQHLSRVVQEHQSSQESLGLPDQSADGQRQRSNGSRQRRQDRDRNNQR